MDDDIQRFCSNIADAARDRRHALQMAELETLQHDIDQRIAVLEEKRAEYEEWLTRRNDFLAKAEGNLVDFYSRMRPDAAAERLHELSEHFDIVWASEWGHNAHTAFREALELPEEPWPFLPVQFDKLAHIRRYAAGLPWIWVDDPLVDLDGEPPVCDDGVVVRVDPTSGIAGLDVDDLRSRVRELADRRAEKESA